MNRKYLDNALERIWHGIFRDYVEKEYISMYRLEVEVGRLQNVMPAKYKISYSRSEVIIFTSVLQGGCSMKSYVGDREFSKGKSEESSTLCRHV